jgi:hypothetical protein
MWGEMRGLLIFHLSTIELLMFRRGEVEEVKENRERVVVEAEDEIPTRNPYQLQVLNHFEEMRLHSNVKWPSTVRNLSAIAHLEVNLPPHPHQRIDQLQLHQQSLSNHLQMQKPQLLQQSSHNKNKRANWDTKTSSAEPTSSSKTIPPKSTNSATPSPPIKMEPFPPQH